MGVTINDIAQQAGVSIATVSHIINKTRYVSPELVEKVENIIEQTGYKAKIAEKESKMMVGKKSIVAFVVPNIDSAIYSRIIVNLNDRLSEKGYLIAIYITNDDIKKEKHILMGLMSNKRISGIILAPVSNKSTDYEKLFMSRIPFVCIERTLDDNRVNNISSENMQAMYMGTTHLIARGHTSISLLIDGHMLSVMNERLSGYKKALEDNGIAYNDKLVLRLDLNNSNSSYNKNASFETAIHHMYEDKKPTAIISGGNKLTLILLTALQNIGIDCPRDVSIVGFGDDEWCELVVPPVTTLKQDSEQMAKLAADKLLLIMSGENSEPEQINVPVSLTIRKSTQMIGFGPFGEKAFDPSEITLSNDEKHKLREGNFKVGISFHYSGTAWTHLHETAIRNTLENYGVSVISVTDAHFDPALQVTQLEAISMQKPDLIIAIPADDKATARKFKDISQKTKLIFISSVPEGLHKDEYASCVSVNERENGCNAAILMGEYYKDREKVKVGLIQHGAPFYGTHLRDMVAEQTLREQYRNIKIVSIGQFSNIKNTFDICKDMIEKNPDIEALYISWDRPALEAIRALKDLNREDIAIFTFDLDLEIGQYLAKGEFVKGLSTQRPYEQGEAVALAAAKALVSNESYKYIGVAPYVVKPTQLLRAWKDIMHESAPASIEHALEEKIVID